MDPEIEKRFEQIEATFSPLLKSGAAQMQAIQNAFNSLNEMRAQMEAMKQEIDVMRDHLVALTSTRH